MEEKHSMEEGHSMEEEHSMEHRIISGRYELGTEEQKAGYRQLFGEEDIHPG